MRLALLPRGAPIGVIAPAGAWDDARLQAGLTLLRDHGHHPVLLEGPPAFHRYLAAPDDRRLERLVHALTDPSLAAVWAVRGGYGVTRLLGRIPWERLPPRLTLGFSDLTPLLDQLERRCGSPALHGPVVHSLAGSAPEALDHLFRMLEGRPVEPLEGEVWVDGRAEGPLRGGNLSLLAATCGTPWQVDARGAILVLEDVSEPAYKIDRMLQQLHDAGVLRGVAGVALGRWAGCRAGETWTLKEVLLDQLAGLGVPVLAELPIGHVDDNRAFPVGTVARIEAGKLSWR